ncbi:hypothetical protein [Jeotgalibacillus sp. JSM ZJ347]|uniref:hypothetical protein n=1 Tax=Jeotgalibacillus sp. JSM ZJ347 TaxID=3342117 RepID=UPI0035A832F5
MGIKTNYLERKFVEALKDHDGNEVLNVLSKDKKLSEKYLKEIAKIDFFPEMVENYLDSLNDIVKSNEHSSDKAFEIFKETREGLQNYLSENSKDLTPEERMKLGEQILEVAKMASKLDADNKKFWLTIANVIGGTLILAGAGVAQTLINKNEVSEEERDILEHEDNE